MEKEILFSSDDINEGIFTIPRRINELRSRIEEAEARKKALIRKVLVSSTDIAWREGTTGDKFLDASMVFAAQLGDSAYNSDKNEEKVLDAVDVVYKRIQDINRRLTERPDEYVLIDLSRREEGGTMHFKREEIVPDLELGLVRLPELQVGFNKERGYVSSAHWYPTVARSVGITIDGYKPLISGQRPRTSSVPMYQFQWIGKESDPTFLSTNITQLFQFAHSNRVDNGVKQEIMGEQEDHLAGIYFGNDKIHEHLNKVVYTLGKNSEERQRAVDLLAVQPMLEYLQSPPTTR